MSPSFAASTGFAARTLGPSSELSERVSEWLQYANDLSLRKRIRRMLDDLDPAIRELITTSVKDFIHKAVTRRNTLTHQPPCEPNGGAGDNHFDTAVRLRALLLAQLFLSCGVPAETIADGLRNEWNFLGLPGKYVSVKT